MTYLPKDTGVHVLALAATMDCGALSPGLCATPVLEALQLCARLGS